MPVGEVGPQVPGAPGRADGVVGAGRRRRQRRPDDRAGMLVTSPPLSWLLTDPRADGERIFVFGKMMVRGFDGRAIVHGAE